jgi:hypothetical protein
MLAYSSALTITVSTMEWLALALYHPSALLPFVPRSVLLSIVVYLPPNAVGDVVAWTSMLWLLRRLMTATSGQAVRLLFGAIASLVFSFILVSFLQMQWLSCPFGEAHCGSMFSDPLSAIHAYLNFEVSLLTSSYRLHMPFPLFADLFRLYYFIPLTQVTLPFFLFLCVAIGGLALYFSRNLLQRPIASLLERLDESDRVATIVAGIFSAIIAVLELWHSIGAAAQPDQISHP